MPGNILSIKRKSRQVVLCMDEEVIRSLMLEEDEGVIRKKHEDSKKYFKDFPGKILA
jgi:hypothetical protein